MAAFGAILGVFFEQKQTQVDKPAGNVVGGGVASAAGGAQVGHGAVDMGAQDVEGLFAIKRRSAREHLEQDEAAGVEVGAAVDGAAGDLLGAHVLRRAHQHAGLCEPRRAVVVAGDAKVDDHDLAGVVDQHVGGLDVSVHHALVVGRGEGCTHGAQDAGGFVGGEDAAGADAVFEHLASDVFHHEEAVVAVLRKGDQRHDPRMIQRRQRPRFEHKALTQIAVARQPRRQHLHRNALAADAVNSEIDGTHAAATELPINRVVLEDDRTGLKTVFIEDVSGVGALWRATVRAARRERRLLERHGARAHRHRRRRWRQAVELVGRRAQGSAATAAVGSGVGVHDAADGTTHDQAS